MYFMQETVLHPPLGDYIYTQKNYDVFIGFTHIGVIVEFLDGRKERFDSSLRLFRMGRKCVNDLGTFETKETALKAIISAYNNPRFMPLFAGHIMGNN